MTTLLERVSFSTLLWARRRADRSVVSREEHSRLHSELQNLQRREHDAALLIARAR